MRDLDNAEYRISESRSLALVPTTAKPLAKLERRKTITRQCHDVVVAVTSSGVAGKAFADWHYDLRRGRLRIFGGLLRFLDTAYERGTSKAVLMLIPGFIRSYIEDLFDPPPSDGSAKKAA